MNSASNSDISILCHREIHYIPDYLYKLSPDMVIFRIIFYLVIAHYTYYIKNVEFLAQRFGLLFFRIFPYHLYLELYLNLLYICFFSELQLYLKSVCCLLYTTYNRSHFVDHMCDASGTRVICHSSTSTLIDQKSRCNTAI